MTVNGVRSTGDDQLWKLQVEQTLRQMADQIAFLTAQVSNQTQRSKG